MTLAHDDIGFGPVVVLLHGFCEDRTLWNYHASRLRNDYRVINVDLPGFGDNAPIEKELTINEFTDEVHDLIIDLGIDRFTLVGHSLGGYVGLSFLERFPHLLNGISMFHSTAFADTPEKQINRDRTLLFIERHGVELFARSFVPPLFNPALRADLNLEIEELVKIASTTSKETIIQVTKAMRNRPDRRHVLEETTIPVQYIVGKADQAVPLELAMKQCDLAKDSHVSFFEKTGHMGMVERPEETSLEIIAFLEYCNQL